MVEMAASVVVAAVLPREPAAMVGSAAAAAPR
jgi:hypothetical protein